MLLAMRSRGLAENLLDRHSRRRLARVGDVHPEVMTAADDADLAGALAGADVLLTGWGAPPLDAHLLARAPRLRLVAHAAGSVKSFVTPQVWHRGIRVSSAAEANGAAVAEYALSMILLSAKRVFDSEHFLRTHRHMAWAPDVPFGNEGSTVGIVGASRIGRRVLALLRPFSHRVLLADPTIGPDDAARLGAEHVTLDQLLRRSMVVSIHAPLLPSTEGMIGATELARLPRGATLINTARGRLVDTSALLAEVRSGRLRAVLDVTDPEPLPPGHPIFDVPGVVLTPHVAGALGNELGRLGASAVAEVEQYAKNGTLQHEVRPEALSEMA